MMVLLWQLNDQMMYYCPHIFCYIASTPLFNGFSYSLGWTQTFELFCTCSYRRPSFCLDSLPLWNSGKASLCRIANMKNFFWLFFVLQRKPQLTEWANIGSQGEKRSICLAQLCTGPGLLVKELKGKWAHPSDFICLLKLCTDLGLE